MNAVTVKCPFPRCGAENDHDAAECGRCGAPVRSYALLSGYSAHLFNRGLAAARENRLAEAHGYFAAVVHWCPSDIEARNAFALACQALGHADEARDAWEEVLRRRPGDRLAGLGLTRPDAPDPPAPLPDPPPSGAPAPAPPAEAPARSTEGP
ncbi:hypothetical protein [Actinomadura litoris]|uniref:hypothetical protein n=1 Tax=Actinomadura litoris TaxID=2678616 RepID=UPI001FA6F4CF|nr:hypothetical protein [Actinomadura litoris]